MNNIWIICEIKSSYGMSLTFFPAMITLRMSLVMGFGPLEENETTNGANVSFTATLLEMVADALLCSVKYTHIHMSFDNTSIAN